MSRTISTPGIVWPAICWSPEAGGYVSDFLAGSGLRKGNPLIACAAGVREALIGAADIKGLTL